VTWEARLILAPAERSIRAGELTVGNHVADLLAVLDACGIERATLVGYCSGAGIALAALKAAPHRFDDLVLVNGEYTLLKEPSCVTQFGSDIDNLLPMASRDLKTAQFILDRVPFDKRFQNGRAPPPGIHLPFSQVHYFHRYGLNYLSYRATDFEMLAREVRRRTLLISGERDLQTNVSSSLRIQQCIPGSRMWVEPEGDHYELLRQGSSTLGEVRSFLSASEGDRHA
jgi:pimeloyl-ACP methyl ester carboxylesterase